MASRENNRVTKHNGQHNISNTGIKMKSHENTWNRSHKQKKTELPKVTRSMTNPNKQKTDQTIKYKASESNCTRFSDTISALNRNDSRTGNKSTKQKATVEVSEEERRCDLKRRLSLGSSLSVEGPSYCHHTLSSSRRQSINSQISWGSSESTARESRRTRSGKVSAEVIDEERGRFRFII